MRIKLTIWMVLAFIGLGTHELLDEMVRPQYGVGEGRVPFLFYTRVHRMDVKESMEE